MLRKKLRSSPALPYAMEDATKLLASYYCEPAGNLGQLLLDT